MESSSPQIPLSRPDLGPREEELLLEALQSGTLSLGPFQERFEHDFAAWLGVEDAVAVSSGTAGLHLAVRGQGWGEGDEVITSPFSFVSSANCLLFENATPVFCDIDPATLNIDPAAAAEAVGERTAGILPVHIFGWPAAMPALERLAAQRGLGVVEDACEALGAVDAEGRVVGSRGNPAVFGFYPNKQMTTGEGGMVVPPGAEAAALFRSERNQGRATDMATVEHERLGFNYRLTELQAALGVAQLERLDEILDRRARVAESYAEQLQGIEDLELLPAANAQERRSWFVYVVLLPDGADRAAIVRSLAEAGIQSKAYMPSIPLFPFYRERFGFREGQFPVAERAAARNLALPFFASIGEAEVERVCGALRAALGAA
jgi:perosamine synthetase